jgi:DNA processing protein
MDKLTTEDDVWKQESVALLALASIQGVGYWTLYKLAKTPQSFKQVLKIETKEAFVTALKELGSRSIKLQEAEWSQQQESIWQAGRQMYHLLIRGGIGILHSSQPEFPKRLQAIPDAPEWLFYQGNIELLRKPAVAMVGTRRPTPDGDFLAHFMVSLCRHYDISTISGLADGIDQQVHLYSLRYGLPTISVLGTGMLRDFPAGSEKLRQEIVDRGGLILTEYLPNQSYSAENFVRRNRLQSALSKIVVPIEWKAKSGTAHTVHFAAEHQRRILCLRLPDWTTNKHAELALGQQLKGTVFTVPDDAEHIKAFIDLAFNGEVIKTSRQLDLWSSEDPPGEP